eukprot:TRINITY_DN12220_c0_g1_i1.p1 TRINITY_DN12220_c0_g1~~TRINITY_DN12220_c0_g1_i1.p1  ORF type:complete len:676 (-),score=266.19 TRINITY_DN12220_c0_g1_i1:189-1991(-)
MAHTTSTSDVEKEKFDSVAKDFMNVGFAITKIESKGKPLYTSCKQLLEITIKLLKAKKAGRQRKYKQRFVKAIGKFNTTYERFCTLLKTKYGITTRVEEPARNSNTRANAAARLNKKRASNKDASPSAKGGAEAEAEARAKAKAARHKARKEKAARAAARAAKAAEAAEAEETPKTDNEVPKETEAEAEIVPEPVSEVPTEPVVVPLAEGWTAQFNEQYQTPFWHNTTTGVSTWVREEAEDKNWTPPAPPVKEKVVVKKEEVEEEEVAPSKEKTASSSRKKKPKREHTKKEEPVETKKEPSSTKEKEKKSSSRKGEKEKRKKGDSKTESKKGRRDKDKKAKGEMDFEKAEDEAFSMNERLERLERLEREKEENQGEKSAKQLAKEEAEALKMEEKLEKIEKKVGKKSKGGSSKKKKEKEKKSKKKKKQLDWEVEEDDENAEYWDGDPSSLVTPRSVVSNAYDSAAYDDDLGAIINGNDDDSDPDESYTESDDEDLFVAFNEAQYVAARTAIENGNIAAFSSAAETMKVNMVSKEDGGNTLLHWAVAYNSLPMVRMLLQHGARNLANEEGVTPYEIAVMEYQMENNSAYFEVKNLLTALAL